MGARALCKVFASKVSSYRDIDAVNRGIELEFTRMSHREKQVKICERHALFTDTTRYQDMEAASLQAIDSMRARTAFWATD